MCAPPAGVGGWGGMDTYIHLAGTVRIMGISRNLTLSKCSISTWRKMKRNVFVNADASTSAISTNLPEVEQEEPRRCWMVQTDQLLRSVPLKLGMQQFSYSSIGHDRESHRGKQSATIVSTVACVCVHNTTITTLNDKTVPTSSDDPLIQEGDWFVSAARTDPEAQASIVHEQYSGYDDIKHTRRCQSDTTAWLCRPPTHKRR